ncbi:Leucine-rich receptor-like protein kinase family protein [Rhynchospora pubera]|uniref:Leucine-rich receptor-like protein kinase family protein n=1 Tax=Rhynchospora pubera TaxID=906938 RepID=A0AAV8EQG1_9POAL|nr:Leucine-rich receptor-like protein kinase family protein [Rhynchospora pubera]
MSSSFFLVSPTLGLGDTLVQILLISLLLLIPSNTIASNGTETERDVLALLSFKSLIWNDPSGALSSWNVSVHHCRWYGIRCGRRHPNRVTALDLNSLQLSGQISSSLANLTFLQRLSLSDNRLSGRIPELGQMMRLRFLNLSVNYLDGTIPPLPGNCSLEYFSLRTNNLKGVVPSNIVQCKKLTVINLNHNFLVGSISPGLGFLQQLTMLSLSVNNLNGTIPATLGNLSNLYILDLYQNHFTGVIPASLGQLQSLQWIQISDNLLS